MSRPQGRLKRAAAIARSGLRRYPRELLASLSCNGSPPAEPSGSIPAVSGLDRFLTHDLAAVWLGHASVMARLGGLPATPAAADPEPGSGPASIGGVTILADPVFSHRVGLTLGPLTFGIQRLAPVPIAEAALPPVDVILITHAHFDHLDRPTLRRLACERTTVVTARNTGKLIPRGFGRVIELDWFCDVELGNVRITAIRPAHWGARMAYDRHRGFNSYLATSTIPGNGSRILFAGDTARTKAFDDVGPVDLAVFGIGAYEPWIHHHANPEQVWEMFQEARGKYLLPIHHSTFKLGEEHHDEPLERLLAAAGGERSCIVGATMGEVWLHGGHGAPHAGGPRGGQSPAVASEVRRDPRHYRSTRNRGAERVG